MTFLKIVNLKLIIIKLMIGSGFVHLKKHDPHIESERYRRKHFKPAIHLILK